MGVRFYIILATIFFANFAFAQPKPRLAHCLTAAHDVLVENFKNEGKYFDSEEKLKQKLSDGCKALPYDITLKAEKGFRIVSEHNNETWSVDENQDFVRAAKLARKPATDPAASPQQPKRVPIVVAPGSSSDLRPRSKADPVSVPQPATLSPQPLPPPEPIPSVKIEVPKNIPMAVLAGDSTPPLVPVPQFVPTVNVLAANVVKKGDDNASKLERCFTKKFFKTQACVNLFNELDVQCGQGGDKVPMMCLELNRHVSSTNLADCTFTGPGSEENYGKCELRARQLKRVCTNPLKEFSFECRGLAAYLGKSEEAEKAGPAQARNQPAAVTPSPLAVAQVPPAADKPLTLRAPAALPETLMPATPELNGKANYYTAERTSISAIRNVQTLDSALRKLLKLRAVTFESRETLQKDVGFVAEEVELVDPTYVQFTEKNAPNNVKVPQISALITAGIQELYGMCKSDTDLQKDMIKRLVNLEGENADLRREVERQTRELIIIKAKLGIK